MTKLALDIFKKGIDKHENPYFMVAKDRRIIKPGGLRLWIKSDEPRFDIKFDRIS